MFEIDTFQFSIQRVWNLYPNLPDACSCESIVLMNDHCVTGSTDGFLRMWSSDFTNVIMEIDLESPVIHVGVAGDRVMCLTHVSIVARVFNELIINCCIIMFRILLGY